MVSVKYATWLVAASPPVGESPQVRGAAKTRLMPVVVAAVGSADKAGFVRQCGADEVVTYSQPSWGDPVDLVLDGAWPVTHHPPRRHASSRVFSVIAFRRVAMRADESDDVWVVQVEQWRVFPRGAAGGNPCPLVSDARELTAGQMRAIAAHYGHESAFVTGLSQTGVTLRYFVPRHEMRMCVHATIAAVSTLISSGVLAAGHTTISTASGEHHVTWNRGGGGPPEVTVAQLRPWFGPPASVHAELAAALGLPSGGISPAATIQPVSVSRAKLIVPVRDADTVHTAQPDLPALWDLCRRLDTTGAYVFAPHPDGNPAHLVARQFPVDAGFPEDPATGVAAGALAAYLASRNRPAEPAWMRITIDQGDAMGQPSSLRAAALAGPYGVTSPSVTGQAIQTGREELSLNTLGRDMPEPELR